MTTAGTGGHWDKDALGVGYAQFEESKYFGRKTFHEFKVHNLKRYYRDVC